MARAEGRYVVIGNIAADQTIPFNPAWLVHLNQRMLGVGGYQAWALRPGLELPSARATAIRTARSCRTATRAPTRSGSCWTR